MWLVSHAEVLGSVVLRDMVAFGDCGSDYGRQPMVAL
jgi:hypothetical protein